MSNAFASRPTDGFDDEFDLDISFDPDPLMDAPVEAPAPVRDPRSAAQSMCAADPPAQSRTKIPRPARS